MEVHECLGQTRPLSEWVFDAFSDLWDSHKATYMYNIVRMAVVDIEGSRVIFSKNIYY